MSDVYFQNFKDEQKAMRKHTYRMLCFYDCVSRKLGGPSTYCSRGQDLLYHYTSWGGQTGGSFGGIDSGWVRVKSWALQLGTSVLFVVVVVTVVILILLIDNSDEEDEEDADDNGIDDDCDEHE